MGGEGIDSGSIAVVFANWFAPIAPPMSLLSQTPILAFPSPPGPLSPNIGLI